MPIKKIGDFKVNYLQVLNEKGKLDKKLKPKLNNKDIKTIYEQMRLVRLYDEIALKLQRAGRMGTYPSLKGQEAIHVGSAFTLNNDDWIVPSFRTEGVLISRGVPIENIYDVYGGDERGYNIKQNIVPFAIPVGTQMLHACGIAYALKFKNKKAVAITYFGEGGTSEGDFHEAMNFAGIFKLPVIFICQNNQYAISVPVKKQTASETLAQKAIAYGFEGIKVDGNDVFAVFKVVKEAIEKAKKGKGPTLIECFTYRMSDHTTADDAKKYRSEKEVKLWEKKDPIRRLEIFMLKKKIANKKYFLMVKEEAEKKVNLAVKKYESKQEAPAEDILKYIYKELPENMQDQLQELKLRKELMK
jgi:pyruvate dehydrogenase E1 component alpha subunit